MESRGQAVLEAALNLPEEERALIAEQLLATLSGTGPSSSDDDFAAELERRFEEGRDDATATIPWADLRDE